MARNIFVVLSVLLAANTKNFVTSNVTIDSILKEKLSTGQKQNVIVSFTQGIQPVIDQVNSMNFTRSGDKRSALTNAQQDFANKMQAPLQRFLETAGVPFETFWINNMMSIKNVDEKLVQKISNISGVANISNEPEYRIDPMIFSNESERATKMSWGVRRIRAFKVWPRYKGKGVIVANIDTGVRYTHEALKNRWRANYGWFDAYKGTTTPNDDGGHGTHTMGTLAGTHGIGVAPEVNWIACKGCSETSCGGSQLYRCGQWIQCPTKPDGTNKNCNMAPDIVSNSWGGAPGDTGYDRIINSWRASGIIPVFSAGNEGKEGCSSVLSPGDNSKVIAVGSTTSEERISFFSSLGPTVKGNRKPDISAPGQQIRSAWNTSDHAYRTISGTSMACPHVSGVIALMIQRKRALTFDEAYKAITKTAVTSVLNTTMLRSCGGINGNTFPNNIFGYGRIDALKSVNAIPKPKATDANEFQDDSQEEEEESSLEEDA